MLGGKSTRFCGKPSCRCAGYPAWLSTIQPLRETSLDSLAPSCSPPSLELSITGTELALPQDHHAQGPAAPQRGRALGAGSSLLGSSEAKQQRSCFFFPGPFMGEQQRGRPSRWPCQMLPVTCSSHPCDTALRGRGRLPSVHACQILPPASERTWNTAGEKPQWEEAARRWQGDGGAGLSSGLRQQTASPLSSVVTLC